MGYDDIAQINNRLQLEAKIDRIDRMVNDDDEDLKESSEKLKEELIQELEDYPEIAVHKREERDFYHKHLKGAASKKEVEAYYNDHPFGYTDKTEIEWALKALSEALAEHEALTMGKAE